MGNPPDSTEPHASGRSGANAIERPRTLRALGWSSAGTGVAFAANILAMIWLSRILGPKIVGASATLLAVCTLFRATFLVPLVQATVTDPGQSSGFRRAAGRLSVAIGLLGCVAFVLAGVLSSSRLDVAFLGQACAIAGMTLAILSFGTSSLAVLQRALDFRSLSAFQAGGALIGSLVAAPLVAYTYLRPLALVAGALVSSSIETAGAFWASRRLHAPRETFDSERVGVIEVVQSTTGLATVGFSSSLALQGDTLAVAATLGPVPTGLYTRAYRLMALPANLLGDVADAVLLSEGTQSSVERLRRTFSSASFLTLVLTWPIGLTAAVVAADLVDILFGPEWSGSVPVLTVLCLALPFRVAYKGPAIILNATRRSWELGRRLAVYAAMVFTLSLVGAQLGLVWVGVGVGISVAVFYVLVSVAAARVLLTPLAVVRDNSLALALALPSALLAMGANIALAGASSLVRLAACCAASGAGLVLTWAVAWHRAPEHTSQLRELWNSRETSTAALLQSEEAWVEEGSSLG